MNNNSLKELASHIIINSLDISMEDNTWQRIGFNKRPKYGEVSNWFRDDWKVDLEDDLMTELIIIYLSFGVRSYSEAFNPQEIINEIIMQLDESSLGINLWKTLQFETNEEFLEFISEGIKSYCEANNNEWFKITMESIDCQNIKDKKLRAKLMVGLAQLISSLPLQKIQFT